MNTIKKFPRLALITGLIAALALFQKVDGISLAYQSKPTIFLPANQKLVDAFYTNNQVSILSRTMTNEDEAEDYQITQYQDDKLEVGKTIILIESREEDEPLTPNE